MFEKIVVAVLAVLPLQAAAADEVPIPRPPQSGVRAQPPVQAPPVLGGYECLSYADGCAAVLRSGDRLYVYVGAANKPTRHSFYGTICWAKTLDGYRDGDIVWCEPKDGKLLFGGYVKGGPVGGFAAGFSASGSVSVGSFGAAAGGSCAGGSCGGTAAPTRGIFRRR